MAKKMQKTQNWDKQIVCEYCGKIKKEVIFVIGASNQPDWCMVEGTGKMTCPDCYNKAMQEGQNAIKKYIESYNTQARNYLKQDSTRYSNYNKK